MISSTKPALLSKGVIGALVAALAAALPLIGFTLSAEDVQSLTEGTYELMIIVSNLVAVGGALVALVGRVWATQRISGIVSTPAGQPQP